MDRLPAAVMSAPKLRDPLDQGAWLACLAAAATVTGAVGGAMASRMMSPDWRKASEGTALLADEFFAEFRARCER